MGDRWLRDLPDVLAPFVGRGIAAVDVVAGWQTRARGSGGLDRVDGAVVHHTASPASWDGARDITFIADGAPAAPISQLYISRGGVVSIIAAGAANHAGRGGPLPWLPRDTANTRTIGVEMGNAGTGEPWPRAQIDAAIAVGAALIIGYGWTIDRLIAHKEWCGPGTSTPGRKIDPFGPWAPGDAWPAGSSWGAQQGRIDQYRGLVLERVAAELAPTTPPAPVYEWSPPMTALHMLEPEVRLVDTRTGVGLVGPAVNREFEVVLPADHDPTAAVVHVTVTNAAVAGGFLELYGTRSGGTSKLNYAPGDPSPQANTTLVAVGRDPAGRPVIRGRMSAPADLIVDLVGVIA
jgi:hypothetical protein